MKKLLRVLNIEDSERDVAILRHYLSQLGYDLICARVDTPEEMRATLEQQEFDVVLCDYSMPRFNAPAALAILKERNIDIPFIIISGTIGEQVAVDAMRAGAQDYLMKDNLARLGPAIERELQEAENRSARRRAEQTIRQNEDRYRDLIEHSQDLICTHDLEGRLLSVNAAAATSLGYETEELIGRNIRDILLPAFHHEFSDYIEEIQQRGMAHGMMTVHTRAGETRVWEYTNTLRTEGVAVPTVRGMAHDVTEKQQAEKALRESEARYRLLFEKNPLPMWVYDLETFAFLAVNQAAVLRYGYLREEFLAMTILDIRPPEDTPELRQNMAQVNGGMNDAGVWKHRKKNGEIIDVEITSHELLFSGRQAELVLANDVTERKRNEELQRLRVARVALQGQISRALAEADASLESILANCAEAIVEHLHAALVRIWTFDQEDNVLELQASAGTCSSNDLLQARVPVGDFKIGLIAQERQPYLTNNVHDDPRVNNSEWALKDGINSFAGYPLLLEGRLVGVMKMFARKKLAEDTLEALASVADIISQGIERKRAEEALLKSEEQLRQAQKMEAIGQLAGGIAHDFNNLLTAINGYSDLTIRKLERHDPLRRNLEEIRKAGDRAASLTRQLLAFSRKQVLQPKILDLNSVISELQKMLQRLIGEDVELRTVLDPELGRIKADPGQIEQVIMNLAVNARDAMTEGGKLTIETVNVSLDAEYSGQHASAVPGPYVMLVVTDTGVGMSEATQKRIFEPFFTTKELGKGTGLGLSTVYGIVKQSGGYIWVYSETGMGTAFKIYLPRVDESAEEYRRSSGAEYSLQGNETILLAEDEEMVRKLASQVLKMYGYKVLESANGGGALSICEHHTGPIDLVITDVVMPEMSGREVAERVSLLRPEMKVLFMSGYTDNAIVHQGILDPKANFIQKPFSPTSLALKVRQVLDKNHK